jgi:GT2 family glycosyltransferase
VAGEARRLEQILRQHREFVTGLLSTVHGFHSCLSGRLVLRYWNARNRLAGTLWYRGAARILRGLRRLSRPGPRRAGKAARCCTNRGYARWCRVHEPGPEELAGQRQARFAREPLVSILVAVHRPPGKHLNAMLASVLDQTYGHWEMCLAYTDAEGHATRAAVQDVARADPRVRLVSVPPGGGAAGHRSAALAAAGGEFVALLDQDDTLAPLALYEVVRALNDHPGADFLYSDEDCLTRPDGRRKHPHFKPDWSPDTLRSHNYVGHLMVFGRRLIDRVGGIRPGYEGAWNYDLVLRASEQAARIVHIPQILYHRRKNAPAEQAGDGPRKALAEHLARLGVVGEVRDGLFPGTFQVRYPLASRPLVSVIIPNKDHADMLSRCVASVRASSYANHEIIVVENGSRRPETFACYDRLAREAGVRILSYKEPFNYAAINNLAAARAAGDVLLFLNNDVEAINPDWLERMLEHALRPEVGVVGAKLYYPDGTVQHAGAIIGMFQGAGHYQCQFPRSAAGYANRLAVVQNLSAVTGACFMTRKSVFEEVRGFDDLFVMTFNDMDLCLKIRERGYRVLWTPFAELYHHECSTRGLDTRPEDQARFVYEMHLFRWKWPDYFRCGDPYYNPNLTLDRGDCALRA